MNKTKILFAFILLLFIFIPLIIFFNPVLFKYKFYLLTIIGLLLYIIVRLCGVKNSDLGLSKNNIISSLKRNLLPIIIFVTIIIIINLLGYKKFTPNETIYFYLFYIFISCPIQEFLYRSLFGYFDNYLINNHILTLLISSFCYSFVHIIYKDFFTCFITFIIGCFWYHFYKKDYNLLGVTLSHSVLGILTIFLGIVN